MTESKLITFLRTLDKEEMRRFGKFLEGTAERKALDRIAFFEYLQKCHPEFPEKKIKRELVAQKLFPENNKRLKKVENLMHKIVSILDDFLAYEELKRQQSQRDFLLLEVYKRRKLDNFFFKKIKKIEEEWEHKQPEGIEHLHNEYLIKKMQFTHPNYSQTGKSPITYKGLIQQLDEYYFAKKLFWTSCMKITEDFVNVSGTGLTDRQYFIQKILDISMTDKSLQNNRIQFLAELLNTLVNEDFQNYSQLEEVFISNVKSFDEPERNDLIDILNHFSIRNRNTTGQQEMLYYAFELNRKAVENKWIFKDEHISVFRFINIVNIACIVRELEWATYFVDNFGTSLGKDDRNDIVAVSHATVDFKKGEYEKTLERLVHVKFRNVLYKTDARAIQLKCYYELEYGDLFHSLVSSFSSFLQNQRKKNLAKDFARQFLNFIKFAYKLEEKRYEFKPNVELILEDIESCDNVIYKRWLIEKAQELIKK